MNEIITSNRKKRNQTHTLARSVNHAIGIVPRNPCAIGMTGSRSRWIQLVQNT